MRVLCDQNVPEKYLRAFGDADGITATTVASVLRHDATDAEIMEYAETAGWVVLTSDDDFLVDRGEHGLLFFSQLDDPEPGAVVRALERIDEAYRSNEEILETVPGDWV